MPFRPAGSDHAIISNVFTLNVDSAIPESTVNQLKTRPAPWSEVLPAARDTGGLEVVLQDGGAPQLRRRLTAEHSFLKPDGTSTWSLRIGGQEITVECNLYTRWDRVWVQAKTLLGQAMAFVREQSSTAFVSFSMTVLDRFVAESLTENTKGVFQASPLLGAKLFDTDALWHQHVGWLEPDADGELLQNVNVDVLPIDVKDKSKGKIVNLSHLQRVTASSPVPFHEDSDENSKKLQDVAERMHKRNKDTLKLMLSESMQRAIKLSGEKK